ncbi:MAG: hypothetical protein ACOYMN_06655 [Roseimicrobium sp.]
MKPRLYMETTIPSLLTSRPSKLPEVIAMQNSTRRWWQERLADFDVFVSLERLRPVCWAHGYELPVLVTPDELMTPLP